MAIRGRVGRHVKTGGRHCQNWADDQQTIIDLLNRIPAAEGGAGGSLGGRVVAGIASDALTRAILRFEDKHFPGQGSGFVDPGGLMLRRMELLAAGRPAAPTPPAATPPEEDDYDLADLPPEETPLDILRRNLLDETQSRGWPAGQRVDLDSVVKLALWKIDSLKSKGLTELAPEVVVFGMAHIFRETTQVFYMVDPDGDFHLNFTPLSKYEVREALPLTTFLHGEPVARYSTTIATERYGALILFKSGVVLRLPPYHHTMSSLAAIDRQLRRGERIGIKEIIDHPGRRNWKKID